MEMKKDTEKVRKRKSTGGHDTSKMAKIESTNQTLWATLQLETFSLLDM